VVLDGGHAVGIGIDERVQGRILLGARAATCVGETLEQQYALVLRIGFQGKEHQQGCDKQCNFFHRLMCLILNFPAQK
jgi:hypothetical protein